MKFLMLLILVVSCSKGPNSKPSEISDTKDNQEVSFAPLSVNAVVTGTVYSIPASSLDFASIDNGQTATQNLIITNPSSGLTMTLTEADFDASEIAPFTVVNGCIASTLPRRNCTIAFKLVNTGVVSEQVLTKTFKMKGVDLQLTGTLKAPVAAPPAGLTINPSTVDFLSLKIGEKKTLSVQITSNVTVSTPLNF